MPTAYNSVNMDGSAWSAKTARQGGVRESPLLKKLILSAAFATGDTINICPIPAGVSMLTLVVDFPILDTGSGMTIAVGDNAQSYVTTGQSTRLVSNQLITNAKMISMAVNGVAGSLGRKYTTADTMILTVVTGPQTGATTGTITFMVDYTVNP